MHVRKWTHLARRVIPCQSCGAVIVAAGSARRMAGVGRVTVSLRRSIQSFMAAPPYRYRGGRTA